MKVNLSHDVESRDPIKGPDGQYICCLCTRMWRPGGVLDPEVGLPGASEGVKYWGGQKFRQKVDPLKICAVKSDKEGLTIKKY